MRKLYAVETQQTYFMPDELVGNQWREFHRIYYRIYILIMYKSACEENNGLELNAPFMGRLCRLFAVLGHLRVNEMYFTCQHFTLKVNFFSAKESFRRILQCEDTKYFRSQKTQLHKAFKKRDFG